MTRWLRGVSARVGRLDWHWAGLWMACVALSLGAAYFPGMALIAIPRGLSLMPPDGLIVYGAAWCLVGAAAVYCATTVTARPARAPVLFRRWRVTPKWGRVALLLMFEVWASSYVVAQAYGESRSWVGALVYGFTGWAAYCGPKYRDLLIPPPPPQPQETDR